MVTHRQIAESSSMLVGMIDWFQPGNGASCAQALESQFVWPDKVKQAMHLVQMVLDKTVHVSKPDTDGVVHSIWVKHGFGGLDQLLAAADWLGMDGCVAQIVTTACECAAALINTKSQQQSDSDKEEEEVYGRLAELPGFPPVQTEWPNMDKLLRLCQVMPAILDCRLGLQCFNNLCGKVGTLYQLPGNRLTDKPGDLSHTCTYDVDAFAGTEKFVVVKCSDYHHLVKLRAGQVPRRECSPDQLAKFVVLGRSQRVPQTGGPGQPVHHVDVSPDNKYLLWWTTVHMSFVVFDLNTGQKVKPCPAFDKAQCVSWAGPSVLSMGVDSSAACLLVDVANLGAVDRLFEPCRGTSALQSKAYMLSRFWKTDAGSNLKWTELTVQQRPATTDNFWKRLDFEVDGWWEDTTDPSGASFVLVSKPQPFVSASNQPQYYSLKVDWQNQNAAIQCITVCEAEKKLARPVWFGQHGKTKEKETK